jgi:hypothetical protein
MQHGTVDRQPDRPITVVAATATVRIRTDRYVRGKIGAGEGIRTLDPDLGKVVLYP